MGFAASLAAIGLLILRSGVFPRWIAIVALLGGLAFFITFFSLIDGPSKGSKFGYGFFPGFLALVIWSIATSIASYRAAPTMAGQSPATEAARSMTGPELERLPDHFDARLAGLVFRAAMPSIACSPAPTAPSWGSRVNARSPIGTGTRRQLCLGYRRGAHGLLTQALATGGGGRDGGRCSCRSAWLRGNRTTMSGPVRDAVRARPSLVDRVVGIQSRVPRDGPIEHQADLDQPVADPAVPGRPLAGPFLVGHAHECATSPQGRRPTVWMPMGKAPLTILLNPAVRQAIHGPQAADRPGYAGLHWTVLTGGGSPANRRSCTIPKLAVTRRGSSHLVRKALSNALQRCEMTRGVCAGQPRFPEVRPPWQLDLVMRRSKAWKVSGLTFAIRDITTFGGEALFWAAILVSNTLGTSMGDFLADSSGLGYAGAALLVAGLLGVLLALKWVPVIPNVLLFWLAFVLTRPLGATAGDFLTKPVAKGGLALGTIGSSIVLLAVLFGLMAHAHVGAKNDSRRAHAARASRVADS
jgi:repeat uncharacterized protein DUF347